MNKRIELCFALDSLCSFFYLQQHLSRRNDAAVSSEEQAIVAWLCRDEMALLVRRKNRQSSLGFSCMLTALVVTSQLI